MHWIDCNDEVAMEELPEAQSVDWDAWNEAVGTDAEAAIDWDKRMLVVREMGGGVEWKYDLKTMERIND